MLSKHFKSELAEVFSEIGQFREGLKSLEVYTEQTAIQLATEIAQATKQQGVFGHKKEVDSTARAAAATMTMFHRMLYFLQMKEQMVADAENLDRNPNAAHSNFFPSILPEQEIQKVIFDEDYISFLRQKFNDQTFSKTTIDRQTVNTSSVVTKQRKLLAVQYEVIKSELKDEYEKRLLFLTKRLTREAQYDPNFHMLSSLS